MMATSNGIRPRSPCGEESAAAGMTVISAGAGEASTLDAELAVTGCCCGLAAGLTPEGFGQREAITVDVAFASKAFARRVTFDSSAGPDQSVVGASLRFTCVDSSACALATERSIGGSVGGFGCLAEAGAF